MSEMDLEDTLNDIFRGLSKNSSLLSTIPEDLRPSILYLFRYISEDRVDDMERSVILKAIYSLYTGTKIDELDQVVLVLIRKIITDSNRSVSNSRDIHPITIPKVSNKLTLNSTNTKVKKNNTEMDIMDIMAKNKG